MGAISLKNIYAIETTKFFENYGEVLVYGIKVECENCDRVFEDISFKRDRVDELINRLLHCDVHECHIADVVWDFIAEESEKTRHDFNEITK